MNQQNNNTNQSNGGDNAGGAGLGNLDVSSGLIAGLLDLSFRKFITLKVVSVLYLLVLVLIALGWLGGVGAAFSQSFGFGLFSLVLFTVMALVQVIFARVGLELVVVIFRIGENTSKMAAKE